jgi:hypothetical protein
MSYFPSTFHYTVNDIGIRVYDDKHVQVTYINLRTLSKLISSLRIQAQIDLQDAINNVGVHAVKDQTLQILGMFASKIFEGISAFWPGGTPAAYISMIIGKIASGIITKLIEQSQPGDEIQSKANEIREGMLAIFDATKKKIDQMVVDPEGHWNEVFHCQDYSDLGLKGDITMSDMAECLDFFPDEETPDYDDFQLYLSQRCKSVVVSKLLPVKWKVKTYSNYWCKDYYTRNDGQRHFDFSYAQYNPHTDDDFWCQKFDGGSEKVFPPYYMIETNENGLTSKQFLQFIMECGSRDMISFSSLWGYLEFGESQEGDRQYIGNHIHYMVLTDNEGNKAPKILSDWLFQNDCYNQSTNKYAVATREEVYTKWGLPGSPKSAVKNSRFSLISIWNKLIKLFRLKFNFITLRKSSKMPTNIWW